MPKVVPDGIRDIKIRHRIGGVEIWIEEGRTQAANRNCDVNPKIGKDDPRRRPAVLPFTLRGDCPQTTASQNDVYRMVA